MQLSWFCRTPLAPEQQCGTSRHQRPRQSDRAGCPGGDRDRRSCDLRQNTVGTGKGLGQNCLNAILAKGANQGMANRNLVQQINRSNTVNNSSPGKNGQAPALTAELVQLCISNSAPGFPELPLLGHDACPPATMSSAAPSGDE